MKISNFSKVDNVIKQIKFKPVKDDEYNIYVINKLEDAAIKPCNGRYLSIDIGIKNLFTRYDNTGKSKDKILNVHHIESRKTGGDAPNNLITLCETYHSKHHNGEIKLKIKRGINLRDATFMRIMRWTFYKCVSITDKYTKQIF